MKDNVLITLDKLDIGGVETFVLNQVKTLRKLGKKVYVMASKGFYLKKIKEFGANFIEYNFEDKIYYDKEEIEKISKILIKNKIGQVHINQFTAINTIMPACLLTKTPYIAYLHMGISFIKSSKDNPYDYYEKQYLTYKNSFEMFFHYASKIIAITEEVKNYTAKRYHISKNKFVVCPNSIDTSEFKSKTKVKKINRIFVIARMSKEKEISILNAIKLYNEIKKKNDKAVLTIAGDGPIRKTIEEFVEENNIQSVVFLGAISNVKEELEKQDVVIGQARCILEAMSMKRIAVISGYEKLKGIVNKDNFNKCINDNFTGRNLRNKEISELAEEIVNLKEEEIMEIIESNYLNVQTQLDITKTIFYLKKDYQYHQDDNELLHNMIELNEILGKSKIEYQSKADEIWHAYKTYQRKMKKYEFLENSIEIIKVPTRVIRRFFKR